MVRPVDGIWPPIRRVVAVVAAYLACVLLPVAAVSSWLATQVSDTDRYVQTVGPLAEDPQLQHAIEDTLQQVVMGAIDFQAQRALIDRLLSGVGPGPLTDQVAGATDALLRQAIENLVHAAVVKVVQSPGFPAAWRAANRSAHQQLVAALNGDDSALDDQGRISVPLSTMLGSVLDLLGDQGINTSVIPRAGASFQLLNGADVQRARLAYHLLDAAGLWLPLVWAGLVALALVLSDSRRRVVGIVSYGSIIAALTLGAALVVLQHWVSGLAPGQGDLINGDLVNGDLVSKVFALLLRDLRITLRAILVLATLVLVVRWISGPDRSARKVRQWFSTVARTALRTPLFRGVLLVVAIVLMLIWLI